METKIKGGAYARGFKKPIIATKIKGGEETEWPSARAFALANGKANWAGNISKAIAGGMPTYGYRFRFRDEVKIEPLMADYASPLKFASDMTEVA